MKRASAFILAIALLMTSIFGVDALAADTSYQITIRLDGKDLPKHDLYKFYVNKGNAYIYNYSLWRLGIKTDSSKLSSNNELGYSYGDKKIKYFVNFLWLVDTNQVQLPGAFPIPSTGGQSTDAYFPLSTICDAFGWYHSWDEKNKTYEISTTKKPKTLPSFAVKIKGKKVDFGTSRLYYTDSKVLIVPVRPVVEALGGTYKLNNNEIVATKGGFTLKMSNNDRYRTDGNNRKTLMACDAFIRNGVAYAPVTAIAAGLGASSSWDGSSTLVITSDTSTAKPTAKPTARPTPTPTKKPTATVRTTPTPQVAVTRAPNVDAFNNSYWSSEGVGLFSVNASGTGFKRIHEDLATYIHVYGDWVYYTLRSRIAHSDGTSRLYWQGIYRIKTSGTERTLLFSSINQDSVVKVTNDWVYYRVYNTTKGVDELYKMKHDGTGKAKLDFAGTFLDICVDGDWVYTYAVVGDHINPLTNISKIKLDGTGKKQLTSNGTIYDPGATITVVDGMVYYGNSTSTKGGTFMIKTDGTGAKKLTSGHVGVFGASEGRVYYYYYANNKMCSLKMDGTGKETQLVAGNVNSVYVPRLINNRIFYINTSTTGSTITSDLVRIKTDGTGRENLTSFPAFDLSSGRSSSGSGAGSSTSGSPAKQFCTWCSGNGWRICLTCDGRGNVQGERCWNAFCSGGRVTCEFCHGEGAY